MRRQQRAPSIASAHRELTAEDAKRFYDRFGAWQDAQLYERAALERLVDLSEFECACDVLELGCGTGRFAEYLLANRLPADARYVGLDISTTMVELASRRLSRWRGRATVLQGDAGSTVAYDDRSFDRIVATYVLDLLPSSVITHVLGEALRLLRPGGKLCLLTLTEGANPLSRLLTSVWKRVYAFNPRLVGGCRPLQVWHLLSGGDWRLEHSQVITSWGLSSEIAIASPAR